MMGLGFVLPGLVDTRPIYPGTITLWKVTRNGLFCHAPVVRIDR
jgi:hypothetical protein